MKPSRLRLRRIRFGMSQESLADLARTTQNRISQIERGLIPSEYEARQLADALNTEPRKLFKKINKVKNG